MGLQTENTVPPGTGVKRDSWNSNVTSLLFSSNVSKMQTAESVRTYHTHLQGGGSENPGHTGGYLGSVTITCFPEYQRTHFHCWVVFNSLHKGVLMLTYRPSLLQRKANTTAAVRACDVRGGAEGMDVSWSWCWPGCSTVNWGQGWAGECVCNGVRYVSICPPSILWGRRLFRDASASLQHGHRVEKCTELKAQSKKGLWSDGERGYRKSCASISIRRDFLILD